jgi:zinc transport system substrate-binding protein
LILVQTIAQEIPNGKAMVLSPIEGIKPEEGIGYLNKMNQDIGARKVGSIRHQFAYFNGSL